jgi:Glyoxalase/Bleomycin resistance protein/Dioxygenase superfamily
LDNPAEITAGAGDCLLQLGEPAQAADLLDTGIAMFDRSFVRDRQIYLTHSADALSRPGKQHDLEAAVEQVLEALSSTGDLLSGWDMRREQLMKFSFHHAAISAIDMTKSITFYEQFGFKVVLHWKDPGEELEIAHLKLGENYLEIFWYKDHMPAPETASSPGNRSSPDRR